MSADLSSIWKVDGANSFWEWLFVAHASLQLPGSVLPISAPPFVILVYLGVVIWSIRWVARDANARGKAGAVVGVFAFFCGWPLSLIFWRWVRPPLLLTPPPLPVGSGYVYPTEPGPTAVPPLLP